MIEVRRITSIAAGMLLALAAGAVPMCAQAPSGRGEVPGDGATAALQQDAGGGGARTEGTTTLRTFYLNSVSPFNDANEVSQAVRNVLEPRSRVYLVPSQNAIVVEASPDQMALAQKVLHDLDRPRKPYRITFTISETEDGKRIGVQHFAMEVVTGQRSTLKQGSKVPIVTGSYDAGRSSANTQITYLDIGFNFDVTLEQSDDGVQLKSKVEQSGIAEEKSGVGPQDPVVRQTVIEGISRLTLGKPLVLGSLDIPGSTRHLAVEALVEQEKP